MTYFLLFRHAHLVLANLQSHPHVKDAATRDAWKQANGAVSQELELLEHLKPKINERYTRYQTYLQERELRARAQQRRTSQDAARTHETDHFERPRTRQVNAHEHKELAAKLAQREHSRRAATVSAPRTDGDDLQRRLQDIRSRVDGSKRGADSLPAPQVPRQDSGYQYPSVPSKKDRQTYAYQQQAQIDHRQPGVLPPALPPKPALSAISTSAAAPRPPRPDKVLDSPIDPPSRASTPGEDRMFVSAATLENGTALRTIFLPSTLRTTFLRIAHKNTLANLETCGFLAGTLMKNAYFVSKLVIPSQTATSDMCEMTNESQLFDNVDEAGLMILGWIHTHPSQTCFMSSRDLHTHSGYQMMLAESIAIVCAPSKGDASHGGEYGIFRLTDPPGKKVILACEKPGIFHPHDVDNIYTDALRPGHVVEVQDMPFDVADLR
jgi:STAM-binding protein